MANIPSKLNYTFTDNQTTIMAEHLNAFVTAINGLIDVVSEQPTPTQQVERPTISISGTTATISCSTSGATIRYAIDGTPTESSGTIIANGDTVNLSSYNTQKTIRAIAYKSGMTTSQVAETTYNPSASVQPPTIYIRDLAIIMTAKSGASIYYTTDGSTPTANSTQYTNAFTLAENKTIKAIAIKNGSSSSVASASFTAPQTTEQDQPQIVVEGNKVTILSNGVGSIRYALNDDSSYVAYTEPLVMNEATVVKARTVVGNTPITIKLNYTGTEQIATSVRYTNKVASTIIDRANSSATTLAFVTGSGTLRFFPVVQNRKYVFDLADTASSSAFYGYVTSIPTSLTPPTTIAGKYDENTPVPTGSADIQTFTVVAENYAGIATSAGTQDLKYPFREIVKE